MPSQPQLHLPVARSSVQGNGVLPVFIVVACGNITSDLSFWKCWHNAHHADLYYNTLCQPFTWSKDAARISKVLWISWFACLLQFNVAQYWSWSITKVARQLVFSQKSQQLQCFHDGIFLWQFFQGGFDLEFEAKLSVWCPEDYSE